MHFFHKTVGLMAVLCAMPAAFAATARPGVITTTASSRMPTMVVKTINSGTTSTGSTTSSALLANSECIDAYRECIRGADACGENFEECTNKVLFHGKMPNCLSTLAQCSSAGVESLFGTSNISALASGEVKNTYGEITDYTYPTNGSVLGQMITAAAISNQYDTSTCVRRVTSCLKKDTVCGDDFELCTTNKEFRKQRVFCDSTLARCQSDGVIELLGSNNRAGDPSEKSRIGEMIAEGAALAAVNSVNTCYKVIDQCFIGACTQNPYNCTAGVSEDTVKKAQATTDVESGTGDNENNDPATEERTNSDVYAYIKNSCSDTIGSNKYCYATFIGDGKMPTNAQLRDPLIQEDVFELAYESRMNTSMRAKIAELLNKFDTRAKQACTDTIKSCAMRVCGGGVGSACYALVKGKNGDNSINGGATYSEIKTGCEAIVNTDANCKYAATNPGAVGTYSYTYIKNDAFSTLFPEYTTNKDPIGVVAALNSSLAMNYSDAAVAQLRKSCENVAKGCIKSMCGSDYTNCYRNRTDIISGTYNTGDLGGAFDKSMNKMGGVLDNNVVIGLCLDTIKNASSCEEHLAIQTAKSTLNNNYKSAWGENGSVRDAWLDANSTKVVDIARTESDVETGLCYPSAYTNQLKNNNFNCNVNALAPCDTVDANGCVYDQKEYKPYSDYVLDNEAETLLQQVMVDIEKEAQATYNAKLTREQNMCLAANEAGGILSNRDLGSTFMWAKLKASRKVPSGYNVNGLKSTQFEASNDLYGSFCRVRVTLQSDDKAIQEAMRNKSWTTAYFAVGDAFTCGSWIPESDLMAISEKVAEEKTGTDASGRLTEGQGWAVAGASILSAVMGGVGTDMLQTQSGLGGLLKTTRARTGNRTNISDRQQVWNTCITMAAKVQQSANGCSGPCSGNALETMQSDVANLARYVQNNVNNLDGTDRIVLDKALVTPPTARDKDAVVVAATKVYNECVNGSNKDLMSGNSKPEDKNFWNNGGGRALVDATGAGLSAAVGGVTTAQIMRASNREQFTAEQQEWMNKVGRHITCYIGGDEAGQYGDVITTSLE